jgi:histone H3/H4
MESLGPKSSDEIINNQEINEDINDIGLPKSSLQSFVKEILTKNKVRGDKNIIPMLDRISRIYVTHISSLGAQICTKCGKKTLNLEHIFEALREMKFNKHIDLLGEGLKFIKSEDIDSSNYEQKEEEKNRENKNLKQFINKKKKRGGRKKKYFENEDERAKMKEMQEQMFAEARNDMNKQQEIDMMENLGNMNNSNPNNYEDDEKDKENEIEDDKEKGKEKYSNMDKKLFINNGGEEDIDFD